MTDLLLSAVETLALIAGATVERIPRDAITVANLYDAEPGSLAVVWVGDE